jgi:hypothetical protein
MRLALVTQKAGLGENGAMDGTETPAQSQALLLRRTCTEAAQ